jgi:hypothetical protein
MLAGLSSSAAIAFMLFQAAELANLTGVCTTANSFIGSSGLWALRLSSDFRVQLPDGSTAKRQVRKP